jgi:hypothetical protein
MLSQAQVFVTDTPFEAVSRARQALSTIDVALAEPTLAEVDRGALIGLRNLAASRVEKYEARLATWLAESEARAQRYIAHEQSVLAQPMRVKV